MGAICELVHMAATKVAGGKMANPPTWLRMLLGGSSMTGSGMNIDEDSALNYAPYWAGVNIIAGGLGMLPFCVYRRLQPRGREEARDHISYRLLHDEPNSYMTSQTFRETMMGHVLTWGNGYAEIQRTRGGVPVALWPLLPDRTVPKLTGRKQLVYEVTNRETNEVATLPADNVLHILGLGFDGLKGYSIVGYHRECIGRGKAVEKFGATFFGQGTRTSGVIEHPKTMPDAAHKRLRESFEAIHTGLDNAHRVAILEEGAKWTPTSIPPDDAQFLETARFGVQDMARILQIPPYMLGAEDSPTYASVEMQGTEFVTRALGRWGTKWHQEVNRKLFIGYDRDEYYAELNYNAMMRGDAKSRSIFYRFGIQDGWMTRNEAREKENLNAIDGLDEPLTPLNMGAAGGQAGKPDGVVRRVAESFAAPMADTLTRMMRKENHDIDRAAKKNPAGLDAWRIGYAIDYEPTFRDAIIPGVDAAAAAVWAVLTEGDAMDLDAEQLVGRHTASAAAWHCDIGRTRDDDIDGEAVMEARRIIDGLVRSLTAQAQENEACTAA